MERIGSDSTRSLQIRGAAGAPGPEVPGLREGASIVFKALAPSSEGRWTVLVGGVRLDAAVAASLKPGSLYSARAERLPDGAWALRVLGPAVEGRASEFLRSSGLPGDAASLLALRALMAEGLPLEPRQIARLRTVLLKKEADEERAALLARALAKGLEPGAYADAVDAASFADGRGEGGGRDPGGRREAQEGRDGGSREEAGGSGGERQDAPRGERPDAGPGEDVPAGAPASGPVWKEYPGTGGDDPESPEALAGLLKTLAGRTGDRPDPRQVFNARSGPGGRWIYVPYRFERGGVAFSGTLRILVPRGSRSGAVLSADVHVDGPGRTGSYAFDLRGEGNALRLGFADRSGSGLEGPAGGLGGLERSLADFGCRVEVLETGNRDAEYPAVDDHA